jgi:hypothetical protein
MRLEQEQEAMRLEQEQEEDKEEEINRKKLENIGDVKHEAKERGTVPCI